MKFSGYLVGLYLVVPENFIIKNLCLLLLLYTDIAIFVLQKGR